MRMVNISNEKSMQSYTARCSRYKNKYTNLVCGKTAVGRNYNLPRDNITNYSTFLNYYLIGHVFNDASITLINYSLKHVRLFIDYSLQTQYQISFNTLHNPNILSFPSDG